MVSTQAGWSMCSTTVRPGARAAREATTRGSDSSMSLVLVRVPGITASVMKVTAAASTARAVPAFSAVHCRDAITSSPASTMTSTVTSGADQ